MTVRLAKASFLATCVFILASAPALPAIANDFQHSGNIIQFSQSDFRTEVNRAALDAVTKIESLDTKNQLLIKLAKADIKIGDMLEARKVLAYSRALSFPSHFPNNVNIDETVSLSVRTGDTKDAFDFVQKLLPEYRTDAFTAFGTTSAENGDFAAAMKMAALINAEQQQNSQAGKEQTVRENNSTEAPKNFQKDFALFQIGEGLAEKGDIPDSIALTQNMAIDFQYLRLLAAIAKAQQKAGDDASARETLTKVRSIYDNVIGDDIHMGPWVAAEAFAYCRDYESARAIINSISPVERRLAAFSRLSGALVDKGDLEHARQMADAGGDDVEDLVRIGEAQAKQGNSTDARVTLSTAFNIVLHNAAQNPLDRKQLLFRVVNSQINIGAFLDATRACAYIKAEERQPFLVKIIIEEAKQKNGIAVQRIIPLIFKTAEESPEQSFSSNGLLGLAEALGKVGYTQEAKSVLAEAQALADKFEGAKRIRALKMVERYQFITGDEAGAILTEQKVAKDSGSLINAMAVTEKNKAEAVDPKLLEALKLIDQAKMEDDTQAKVTIQKAIALLGNNTEELEALIFMPGQATEHMAEVDEQIERHHFSVAMKYIQFTSGMTKDALLGRLSLAEFEAGELKPALDSANSISDPFQRAQSMIYFISVNGDKTL